MRVDFWNHRPTQTALANARAGRSTHPACPPHTGAVLGRARAPRAPQGLVAVCSFFALALTALAANPAITVSAKQRYPWNGLVDLRFMITGEDEKLYDTSFTAKDMVGGTNIAMKTIRKADGSAAATKEQLLPGTYNWVWDAAADLSVDSVVHDGFLTTSSSTLFTNRSLDAITGFSAVFGGTAISRAVGETINGEGYNIKTDGQGKSVQFQLINGGYLKCVCVHLEQAGNDIVGYIKWSRYMANTFPLGTDFDSASYTQYNIATSDTESGYGISSMTICCPNPKKDFKCDRVTVTGTANEFNPLYMVIDLSGGANASSYPVSYLADVPSGGWGDTYKTTKLVLRRCGAGTFTMGSPSGEPGRYSEEVQHKVTLTKDFYIGVYEITQKQYALITGKTPCGSSSYGKGDSYPVHYVSYNDLRGSTKGAQWPTSDAVDATSFAGILRTKTGISGFDLPTEAQWEYACRSGTTGTYAGTGNIATMAWYSGNAGGKSHPVGGKTQNQWGLYDMHGNVQEWTRDWFNSRVTSAAVADPAPNSSNAEGCRVRRGGSWYDNANCCRSADRQHNSVADAWNSFPNHTTKELGFRISVTLE